MSHETTVLQHTECPRCGAPNLGTEVCCFACGARLKALPKRFGGGPAPEPPWPLWIGLVLILIVLLIVVGPARLPEIAASIGRGIRKLKMATAELSREVQNMADDEGAAAQKGGGGAEEGKGSTTAEAGTDLMMTSRTWPGRWGRCAGE